MHVWFYWRSISVPDLPKSFLFGHADASTFRVLQNSLVWIFRHHDWHGWYSLHLENVPASFFLHVLSSAGWVLAAIPSACESWLLPPPAASVLPPMPGILVMLPTLCLWVSTLSSRWIYSSIFRTEGICQDEFLRAKSHLSQSEAHPMVHRPHKNGRY